MDKPQFNPDDKPVFNLFDLPAFCEETSPATKPCCGPCTDWLFCIKRSPIELKLPGFDFSAWLPSVSMCATKIMPSSGVDEAEFTNTDGSNEFDGTYLTLPDSHFLLEGDCGTRTNRCENDSWGFLGGTWWGNGIWGWGGWWWGWWWNWLTGLDYPYEYYPWYDYFYNDFYGRDYAATHHMLQPRTVYAPAAVYGQIKYFYIDAQVRCVLNDEDQPCLEFLGLLRFSWEKAGAGCIGCTLDDYGIPACDPSILNAIDDAEGWDNYNGEYKYCVPLMRSDLIPLDGLSIASLSDIPLTMIPPPTWELVSPGGGLPDYWAMTGGSFGGCVLPELGIYRSVGWMTGYNVGLGCTPEGSENTECGGTEEGAPARDAHPTGHTCSSGIWLPQGCGYGGIYYGYGSVCVPPPITANGTGSAGPKLSVLSSCFPVDGCGSCLPDPENPNISKKVEFSVEVSGSGCYKTFTPVITDCVNVVKVYYSWGDVGVGLDPVTHTIVNTDDGGVSRSETFTAIAVDDRGCYYCFKDTAICGCCPETSGTLEVTSTGLNAFRLCATTNGTPTTGPCAGLETVISWTGEHVIPNSGTLGNGDCADVTVTGGAGTPRITYRVIDGAGCIGDPVELELYRVSCGCCVRPLNGVKVTIDGWDTFNGEICQNCDDFNQTYELHPDVGADFTCLWKYSTSIEPPDGPNLVCRPPSGESLGYIVGREIFFSIQCVGDGKLLLCVYANMSEATMNYYAIIDCSSGPPFYTPVECDAGLHPVECDRLIGDEVGLTRDMGGIHCGGPFAGACRPFSSTCVVTLNWGS